VGIAADGLVGRATKAAIRGVERDDADSDVLSIGSRGTGVRTLQKALAKNGYDPGPADGIFGPMTLTAVLSFQRYERLWVDGLVGPRTKSSLGML
jgi:peptidoglycan hydrolase-like protein with peptidoglycan-binding domain